MESTYSFIVMGVDVLTISPSPGPTFHPNVLTGVASLWSRGTVGVGNANLDRSEKAEKAEKAEAQSGTQWAGESAVAGRSVPGLCFSHRGVDGVLVPVQSGAFEEFRCRFGRLFDE